MNADDLRITVDVSELRAAVLPLICDTAALDAIKALMATHGHTLTVEQRAAVRGWLGRVG